MLALERRKIERGELCRGERGERGDVVGARERVARGLEQRELLGTHAIVGVARGSQRAQEERSTFGRDGEDQHGSMIPAFL